MSFGLVSLMHIESSLLIYLFMYVVSNFTVLQVRRWEGKEVTFIGTYNVPGIVRGDEHTYLILNP